MATGYINLPMLSLKPDIDAPPQLTSIESTASEPNPEWLGWAFDGTAAEYLHAQLRMPGDYGSAPVLKLQWQLNAITNAVVWTGRIAAITPSDAETPNEKAAGTINQQATNVNTTEANRLTETTVTLTNADSLAAGDLVDLIIGRLPTDAGDTSTVDAVLLSAELSYTTA